MPDSRDPFYIVQEEADETLKLAHEKYTKLKLKTTTNNKALHEELQEDCHSLLYMIDEIDKSIDAAEKNPQRFNLSQAELSERRKWVLSTRRKLDSINSNTAAPLLPKQNTTSSPHSHNTPSPHTSFTNTSASSKLAAAVQEENDNFIHSESERQQILMGRQDMELDELNHHVVRIGELGREMGQELDIQGQMLDDLHIEMDGTSTRLALAQKKVQYVLDKAGSKGQLIIIAVLVVVLVVLIVLALA